MIVLAFVISIIASYLLGRNMRKMQDLINFPVDKVKSLLSKPEKEQDKSTVYDPDDVEQQIKFQHEERMRKLNPDAFFESEDK